MASRQKTKSKGRRGWWRNEFYDFPENPTNELFNILRAACSELDADGEEDHEFDDTIHDLLLN